MMKKIISTLAAILLAAGITIAFTACTEERCTHQWGDPVVVEAPTCSTGGYSTSTCALCGETTRNILFKSDHTYAEEWSFDGTYHWHEATCQHAGQTITDRAVHEFDGGRYCTVCGTVKATQGLSYVADATSGTYTVTGCKGTFETEIVVAKYYNNTLIAAVGESAFANSTTITSVYLQEYITYVGDYAFAGSKLISEVTFSRGLEYIGSQIFKGCDVFTTLVFRGTLAEFEAIEKAEDWDGGHVGFTIKCTDGEIPPPEHTFSDEWSYDSNYHWHKSTCGHDNIVSSYGAHVFEGSACTSCGIIKASQGLSYRGDLTTGTYIVIGLGTTLEKDIVVARFYNNIEITGVDTEAFSGVKGLNSVHLQSYIRTVGDRAFADSTDLTTVTLTKGIEYIGSEIFAGCTSLTEVIFQGSLAEWEAIEKAEDWNAGHTGYVIKFFGDVEVQM